MRLEFIFFYDMNDYLIKITILKTLSIVLLTGRKWQPLNSVSIAQIWYILTKWIFKIKELLKLKN